MKDIPISIIYVVAFSALVYVFAAFSITGIGIEHVAKHYQKDTAIDASFELKGLKWMAQVIYVAAFFGMTANTLAMINS